ncbi:PPOX class F420-dependent oxidoreductase [bacterium]|nr:PPOX class F420-dependent oxidoreductase [bacterium]
MSVNTTFDHQSYLNLETYRKNGSGVKTPVWFVEEGGVLLVRTDAASGKVKRIHNHRQVRISPCKMDGALLGNWIEASARQISDREIDRKVDRLLSKKYGLLKSVFNLAAYIQGRKNTILEIKRMES